MQKLMVGWDAGSCNGVEYRTVQWDGKQNLGKDGIKDPVVCWDTGSHSGLGCRSPQWGEMQDHVCLSPISARLELLPNLRISMSLASREPAVA